MWFLALESIHANMKRATASDFGVQPGLARCICSKTHRQLEGLLPGCRTSTDSGELLKCMNTNMFKHAYLKGLSRKALPASQEAGDCGELHVHNQFKPMLNNPFVII